MNYKKVISNASPLIALSKISELDILRDLFGKIIIPKAVYIEVIEEGKYKYNITELERFINEYVDIIDVENIEEVKNLQKFLDYGEAEVLILAKETDADLLILDNKEPRIYAKNMGFKIIGTIGIIILAYKNKLLKNPVQKIFELKEKGFYISENLLEEIIKTIKDL